MNKRALRGHRRVLTPIGEMPNSRKPPTGGWEAACICGWKEHCADTNLAYAAYKQHLDVMIDSTPMECRRCGVFKLASEMSTNSRYLCVKCFSQKGNDWQLDHPEAAGNHKRNYSFLKNYGITLDDAWNMLLAQDCLCLICGNSLTAFGQKNDRSPHVDHDHATGKVRGILCFTCNVGMGMFKDDVARLQSAIRYLEKSRE